MSLEDLLFPENAALSWLPPPSIKGQFVSFLKSLLPCLELGAPGHYYYSTNQDASITEKITNRLSSIT